MPGIHDLRGQERHDIGFEIVLREGHLALVQLLGLQVHDALVLELGAKRLEASLIVGVELMAAGIDSIQLLRGSHAGFGIDDGLFDELQVSQTAHAHHEELLEV